MVKPKKILFVITQSDFGGAQRYVFDLASSLTSQGYAISVAAGLENGELFTRLEKLGVKIHRLRHLKRSINFYQDWLAIFELKNIIASDQPDIIHLNSTKAGILGSLAVKLSPKSYQLKAKSYDFKAIYTAHGWAFNEPLPNWLKSFYLWCEKWTAQYKHKIICVSDYDRQIAIKNKLTSPEKLVTIHNGLDYQKMHFLSKEEALEKLHIGDKSGQKIIGCVANFYPTKGLSHLVEALTLVKEPSCLVLIGDGPQRKELESQILRHQLQDRVLLAGALPHAHQYLKAFDVFVLPSIKEGFPYVLLEAMAAGRPIIATRVGGVPEMIANNINGFLVTPADAQALAAKINHLLENEKIAGDFAQKSLEKIKGLNLSPMVEKTKQVYEG